VTRSAPLERVALRFERRDLPLPQRARRSDHVRDLSTHTLHALQAAGLCEAAVATSFDDVRVPYDESLGRSLPWRAAAGEESRAEHAHARKVLP
jgi:hypothetical protein